MPRILTKFLLSCGKWSYCFPDFSTLPPWVQPEPCLSNSKHNPSDGNVFRSPHTRLCFGVIVVQCLGARVTCSFSSAMPGDQYHTLNTTLHQNSQCNFRVCDGFPARKANQLCQDRGHHSDLVSMLPRLFILHKDQKACPERRWIPWNGPML